MIHVIALDIGALKKFWARTIGIIFHFSLKLAQ